MGEKKKKMLALKKIKLTNVSLKKNSIAKNLCDNLIFPGLWPCIALLSLTGTAVAVTSVDVKDDRKAKSNGFDLIYEARDLDLPQDVRDGLTQARSSIDETKNRVVQLKKCITLEVPSYIKKAYWTEARESLRLRVGTLRFDLNTLVEAKPRAEKKIAVAAKKQFFNDVEKVDYAIREKNMENAIKAYEIAVKSLDAVLANVL